MAIFASSIEEMQHIFILVLIVNKTKHSISAGRVSAYGGFFIDTIDNNAKGKKIEVVPP
jgi:hypothetical protein